MSLTGHRKAGARRPTLPARAMVRQPDRGIVHQVFRGDACAKQIVAELRCFQQRIDGQFRSRQMFGHQGAGPFRVTLNDGVGDDLVLPGDVADIRERVVGPRQTHMSIAFRMIDKHLPDFHHPWRAAG